MLCAEPLEHTRELLDEGRVGNAENLGLRTGRVRERAEDVEHGSHADLPAQAGGELHRRVEGGSEHEGEARALEAGGRRLRRQLDLAAERLEDVGGAAGARNRAVAVLGDARARAGGDERRGGADVERSARVAAGAARIEQRAGDRDAQRLLTHGARHADDLVDGLAFHAQRDDERAELRGCGLARHDLIHAGGGLVLGEVAPFNKLGDGFTDRGSITHTSSDRRTTRITSTECSLSEIA